MDRDEALADPAKSLITVGTRAPSESIRERQTRSRPRQSDCSSTASRGGKFGFAGNTEIGTR